MERLASAIEHYYHIKLGNVLCKVTSENIDMLRACGFALDGMEVGSLIPCTVEDVPENDAFYDEDYLLVSRLNPNARPIRVQGPIDFDSARMVTKEIRKLSLYQIDHVGKRDE